MNSYLKILKLIMLIVENGKVTRDFPEYKAWEWKDLFVIESIETKQVALVNSSDLNICIPPKFYVGGMKQFDREYQRISHEPSNHE